MVISRGQLKEILTKNWMIHDAMWFYHCLNECGIETTNKINKAAIKYMHLLKSNVLPSYLILILLNL
jgi:hypothetical protein